MSMIYTNPGEMNRLVDIWDQPPNALPVLFASDVWAKIATVPTTTLSPVSPDLNQNTVWPRIKGQDVAELPHMCIIRYMPGLLSRMLIVYDDPDNGERYFDVDRIADPDAQKVELHILAIERKDGQQDPFDTLLTTTCDVLTRNTTGDDKRGMASPAFATVGTAVPCRVSMNHGVPRGQEELAKTKLALAYRKVFLRPWFADASPDGSYIPFWVYEGTTYNTKPLTHDNWLLVPSQSVLNSNEQATTGVYYDIYEIDNPGGANHHLEAWCRVVIP